MKSLVSPGTNFLVLLSRGKKKKKFFCYNEGKTKNERKNTLNNSIEAYGKDGGLYLKHNQRHVLLILVGSVFQMGSIIQKMNAENEQKLE